jgi:hypothetical protein
MLAAMRRWLLIAVLLVAGCGSSAGNDEAGKPAKQVVADAERVALAAKALHVVGHTLDGSTPLRFDIWLRRGRAKGHFVEGGAVYDAVRVGSDVWARGNAAFVSRLGSGTAGEWLRGTATTGPLAPVASLLDREDFVQSALGQHGKLVNRGTVEHRGEQVIEIRDTTEGGSLYVAAGGTPYPVGLVAGTDSAVEFRDWDQTVEIRAPE